MKVQFIHNGSHGHAEYDSSTDSYSWSFGGDDSDILESLKSLDDGKMFVGMDSAEEPYDTKKESVIGERYFLESWEEQIERLSKMLEFYGADVVYVGE